MTRYTNGHTKDCDYHLDQYPHECTCGVSWPIPPKTSDEVTAPKAAKHSPEIRLGNHDE